MSLFFYILSGFVIAFLPSSKCLLSSWLQSSSTVILEPKKIKSLTAFSFFPSICHKVMELDAMILVFWMLGLSRFFTLLFHSPLSAPSRGSLVPLCFLLWYHLHIPGYWSFSWKSWFQFIIHPAQHFHRTFSACKFNKQDDNIQPVILLSQFWASQLFHVQF